MVLRRLFSLFGRYASVHERLTLPTRHLSVRTHAGLSVERLSAVLGDGQLQVAGRTKGADEIILRFAGKQAAAYPPASHGAEGFDWSLQLPWLQEKPGQPPAIELIIDGESAVLPDWPSRLWLRWALIPGFLIRLVFLVPAGICWLRTHEQRYRSAIRRGLGLDTAPDFGPLDPAWLPSDSSVGKDPQQSLDRPVVTIVLPVYNAFDLLDPCLNRIRLHTDLPWRIVLVDDASPDPRIGPFLEDWVDKLKAAPGELCRGAKLVGLSENLGFVGAVNTGLDQMAEGAGFASGGPVILLNSDAFVPAGWTSRLVAPLADPSVASVTPMSNAAEILSVPVICTSLALAEGEADRIDARASRIPPADFVSVTVADLPTGVGFCMALSPHFLDRVPRFDTAFGRGYGEEVDWCQKTRVLGGRHVAQERLFVEHHGHASFGAETSTTAVRAGGDIISRRYPGYDAEVQGFIRRDPLRSARLVLGLEWAAAQAERLGQPLPVYLAHSMGGGAEIWLQEAIATDLARGLPSLVLRVGGLVRWQIELAAPGGLTGAVTGDFDLVRRSLAILPHKRIVYSCGVGDADPVTLPGHLLALKGPRDELEVLFHDWFPVSPSFTLLESDGVWRGVPVAGVARDRVHCGYRPDGRMVDLAAWQAEWGRLLRAADRVTVFSGDGLRVLYAVWPDLGPDRVLLRPHVPAVLPDAASVALSASAQVPVAGGAIVIAVLGNLNRHKGADVVAALARRLRGRDMRLVLIGTLDPALNRPRGLIVHGAYARADIGALARYYGVTHWLVPAVWPETFSYATHEALATGLPVMAFDLGAQGEAVRATPNGIALPFTADPDAAAGAVLKAVQSSHRQTAAAPGPGQDRRAGSGV